MKAILIDPFKLDVIEIQIGTDYREIYPIIQASTFECIQINEKRDTIFIDEEGMLSDLSQQSFFTYEGVLHPIVGKGLILGTDSEGAAKDPAVTLAEVINAVSFLTPYQVQRWANENPDA